MRSRASQLDFVAKLLRTTRLLDPVLLFLTVALLLTGVLFIYGAGRQMGGNYAGLWIRQLLWIGLGLGAAAAVLSVDYRKLGRYSLVLYLGGATLLVLVLIIGREINGARSWLAFGRLTLQPAELMKPATVLALAWAVSRPGIRMERGDRLLLLLVLTGIPVALIGKQPDYGTALVFLPIGGVLLFLGGIRWRWIVAAALAIALLAPVLYRYGLAPHQRERIQTFLQPTEDIANAGWNAHQSMLAVGSGGLMGKGYMQGTQYVLGYLPRTVASTDFIFSVLAEESGFVGAGAVLIAFLGIVLCCLRAATVASDAFGAYIAAGVAVMISVHIFINVGMTIRVAPIIGIPLPLVSYGGSFMLSTLICLALVQNVYVHRGEET